MPAQDKPRFIIREHPADVGIIARGATMAEAFQHTAEGMFSLMVDLKRVRPQEAVEVRVQAEDRETLLVAWLSELLFVFETEHLVCVRFDMDHCRDIEVVSRAWGEPYNPKRHGRGAAVKAVTFHRLRVVQNNDEWETEVTFDV